jgi:hypothetical protein
MLKARLKTMKSVLFKSDKTKSHKDDSLHCWLDEQAKLQYSKADRMLFYMFCTFYLLSLVTKRSSKQKWASFTKLSSGQEHQE